MDQEELANLYLKKLENRFDTKIEPDQYYLSYSGGMDSHLLYWFIREKKKLNDIEVVSVNTRLEFDEIRKRMYENADIVLTSNMIPNDVIKEHGMPCFSKFKDEMIRRYQNGSRTPNTIGAITGINKDGSERTKFKLNKKQMNLVINEKLHNVSPDCCLYTKKIPLYDYEKKTNRKPIIGVRKAESSLRDSKYETCLAVDGKFTPLYDFTDDAVNAIYTVYCIDKPKIYDLLKRTGCVGCPYGYYFGDIELELSLMSESKRNYIIGLFKDSYDVLGVNYREIQLNMFNI